MFYSATRTDCAVRPPLTQQQTWRLTSTFSAGCSMIDPDTFRIEEPSVSDLEPDASQPQPVVPTARLRRRPGPAEVVSAAPEDHRWRTTNRRTRTGVHPPDRQL